MAASDFYTSPEWRALRERRLALDRNRCTVAHLLGGRCHGTLHVHHIEPVADRPDLRLDLDNTGTACAAHHPAWEALARALRERREDYLPPCPYNHPTPAGRAACDRRRRAARLARQPAQLEIAI